MPRVEFYVPTGKFDPREFRFIPINSNMTVGVGAKGGMQKIGIDILSVQAARTLEKRLKKKYEKDRRMRFFCINIIKQ